MCGLADNKKDGVSDASGFKPRKVQSEFLFLCVKDEKRRKKNNEKKVKQNFRSVKKLPDANF